MPLIIASIQDEIGFLTLNCPEKHNALSARAGRRARRRLAAFGRQAGARR